MTRPLNEEILTTVLTNWEQGFGTDTEALNIIAGVYVEADAAYQHYAAERDAARKALERIVARVGPVEHPLIGKAHITDAHPRISYDAKRLDRLLLRVQAQLETLAKTSGLMVRDEMVAVISQLAHVAEELSIARKESTVSASLRVETTRAKKGAA